MKKRIGMLLSLLLVISCTACGTEQKQETDTEAGETGEGGLSGSVTFLCGETDEEQVEVVKKVISDFEAENPGCEIELVLSGQDDREQTILTELYAGGAVDIITVDSESLGAYTENALLHPVDDLIAEIGESDFMEGSRVIVDGHDYAMPYAGFSQMLYVRTDMLKEKNLEIPTTWDELLDTAKQLTDKEKGIYGMCLPAGTNNCTELWMNTFCLTGGTSLFDENMQPHLDTERVQSALKFYTDLCAYCPEGITSYGYGDQISAFLSGNCAMTIYQGRVIARIAFEAPELIGKYEIAPIPGGNGLTAEDVQLGGYTYFAIGAGCKNPELAQAFLKYLCTGENAVSLAMSAPGHITPALNSVAELLYDYLDTSEDEIVQTSGEYIRKSYEHATADNIIYEVSNAGCAKDGKIEYTGVFNSNYAYIRSYNILSNMVQKVLINGEEPGQVCADAQKELEEIIAEGN